MKKTLKLTDEEKQNGKRKLLIPSKEVQKKMRPISVEEFTTLVKKVIPPSPPRPIEEK